VIVKFGIKTSAMLSSLVLALVFVAGCNSEDATTDSTPKPGGGAGAGAAVKPVDAKPITPPVSKPDEKKP
jgi:uncharacterized spore protein YtfJ